jgi:hypothetical protein
MCAYLHSSSFFFALHASLFCPFGGETHMWHMLYCMHCKDDRWQADVMTSSKVHEGHMVFCMEARWQVSSCI